MDRLEVLRLSRRYTDAAVGASGTVPTAAAHAASKQYVDAHTAAADPHPQYALESAIKAAAAGAADFAAFKTAIAAM